MSFEAVVFGLAIAHLGVGLLSPNLYVLAAVTGSDAQRALILGLTATGLCVGQLLGQAILEPVAKQNDAGMPILLLALLSAALSVGCVWQTHRVPTMSNKQA